MKKASEQTLEHRPVGTVCDGEHVRRHLMALYALVPLHDLLRVDGQLLVRIDHHAEQAGICLRRGKWRWGGDEGRLVHSILAELCLD